MIDAKPDGDGIAGIRGIRAWSGTIWLGAVAVILGGTVFLSMAGPCRFGSIAGLERRIGVNLPPDTVLVDGCFGFEVPRPAAWAVLRMPSSSLWDFVSDGPPWSKVSQEPENWVISMIPRLNEWHPNRRHALISCQAGDYDQSRREISLCLQADGDGAGMARVYLFWLEG